MKREVDRVEGDVSGDKAASAFEPFFETEYPRLIKALYLTTGDLLKAEELAPTDHGRAHCLQNLPHAEFGRSRT